ncbi:hypothetical protein SAMN05892883_2853 [Jatrophihabitans sp. GAS493]|uniref:hypothetical protein n=1 Tax=Jatrophihabitans sp. GAS493 TaxID=1907575 RepID=UPI000BB84E51|nr:hypothetical protein [Jatrophihabitans sp. GAS493]SOD73560.1 hypothetical protein SAMN05892883_2853 [Jatrophihabitans sp. GAS493]
MAARSKHFYSVSDLADLAKVKPDSLNTKLLPAPDVVIGISEDPGRRRVSGWSEATAQKWLAERPGRTGRPKKLKPPSTSERRPS